MKIDIYHIYLKLRILNIVYPIAPRILRHWSESHGWAARTMQCAEPKVDYSTDADIIAFSIYTQTAKTSYRIAEKFRKMGKIVIFGGPHFRGQTYKEALDKCDVVATSISEEQWGNILDRIASGEIAPGSEKALFVEDMNHKFRIPGDMYKTVNHKKWYQAASVCLSYGCPYSCDFCSPFMGGKYATRDIDAIYKEVEAIKGNCVFIPDATFGLDKKHTIETMEAIAPLGKKIFLETSLRRMLDMELLKALAKGGVVGISIGIESLSSKMKKHGGGDVKKTVEKLVNDAHDLGIAVEGNFILGLDSDTDEVFDEIFDFYKKSNIDLIVPSLLIPYPNTKLFNDMLEEGRIIDTDWDHYDTKHLLYKPKRMSADQLVEGTVRLLRNLSRPEIVFQKTAAFYKRNGLTMETGMAVGHDISRMLDFIHSARKIRNNHQAARLKLEEQEAKSPVV